MRSCVIYKMIAISLFFVCVDDVFASFKTIQFPRKGFSFQFEVWKEDIIHFEVSTDQTVTQPIWMTPSVQLERKYEEIKFTQRVNARGDELIETAEIVLHILKDQPCFMIEDKIYHRQSLTKICAGEKKEGEGIQLKMEPMGIKQIFGLGQQLDDPKISGKNQEDWLGKKRESPHPYGNVMKDFFGGAVGDTQIPVLYAMGKNSVGYGLYFDSLFKISFDFRNQPWKVTTKENSLRGFFFNGPNLIDWRRDYMNLTGKPLVPPRKMFGLWVSEYGYDNWSELESKLQTLKKKDFPIDGFVMDLQWFGGVKNKSDDTSMGKLQWDEKNFPQPSEKIAELARDKNIGFVLIEESYVGRGLKEHKDLSQRQMLVKNCETCEPAYIIHNPWWGTGGMIDWSNPEARRYWAKIKRRPLVDMGIMGHWTDLGEPEMYNEDSWYYGWPDKKWHQHTSVHNYFSFFWHQGIAEEYHQFHSQRRPFILSRSAAPGSQRFGVGMWSADIASNMNSLNAHFRSQMNMSLSGFDYYGSDVGGFHRGPLDGDLNQLYTQWLANSSFIDVPVRPHTENICNCKETAPDRVGDEQSNRENLKLRYRLAPYYYSLAHRAHELGDAIFPPVFYYFQNDLKARGLADQKMIGPFLMVGNVASYKQQSRQIYLPSGIWYEFYSGERLKSKGKWIKSKPFLREGHIFQLPLYVRGGAVLPLMNEKNRHLGPGLGLATTLKVYPAEEEGEFVLYEDDGETTDYLNGRLRKTKITHGPSLLNTRKKKNYVINIDPSVGDYKNSPLGREWSIEVFVREKVNQVTINKKELIRAIDFNHLDSGNWFQSLEGGKVWIKIPQRDDQQLKNILLKFL